MNRKLIILIACCCVYALFNTVQAQTIGVHTWSIHAPQHSQNNTNPGLYLAHNGWEIGAYRNSWERTTVYAGYEFNLMDNQYGELGIQIGAGTGYQEKCTDSYTYTPGKVETKKNAGGQVKTTTPDITTHTQTCSGYSRGAVTPLGAFSYKSPVAFMGLTPRVQVLPGFGKHSSVLHLTFEAKWK